MKFTELPACQAWPLEKKIEHSIEWIQKGFLISRHACREIHKMFEKQNDKCQGFMGPTFCGDRDA